VTRTTDTRRATQGCHALQVVRDHGTDTVDLMTRIALAVIVIAGCATSNKNGPRAGGGVETDDGMVCTEVQDTGTLFSHTECKPREQRQAETDAARRLMQAPRTTRDAK
jgi:hypothetical protein